MTDVGDAQIRELREYEVTANNTVEALIMPWDTPTEITEWVAGRPLTYPEQFARGAFTGAENGPHRVTLNWGHSNAFHDAIGKGTAFHDTPSGEIAVFKLNDSDAPRARELIRDMGLSVSFRSISPAFATPARSGQLVTRSKVHLLHVAVVATPAYPDPKILAMREADAARQAAERAAAVSDEALSAALNILLGQGRELTPEQRHWIDARQGVASGH